MVPGQFHDNLMCTFLLAENNTSDTTPAATSHASHLTSSASMSPGHSRIGLGQVSPNWAHEFQIPWSKMSKRDLISIVEKGKRPTPKARREMVRVIMDDVVKQDPRPGKKALECITRRIVAKYPSSFKDVLEGSLVGSGHESLCRQLINRAEHQNGGVKPATVSR